MGDRVIITGKGTDVVDRVEERDGGKLDLALELAPQQVGAVIALKVPTGDLGEDARTDNLLIRVSLVGRSSPSPDASDHRIVTVPLLRPGEDRDRPELPISRSEFCTAGLAGGPSAVRPMRSS